MKILILILGLVSFTFAVPETLSWLVIGDYGFQGLPGQLAVAERMEIVAKDHNVDFVIGTGDNFYNPDGVTSVEDNAWNQHWADVYQWRPTMSKLKWYGVLGNHDYNTKNLTAEFLYDKYGWVLKDFVYSTSFTIEGKELVFVHVDTSFLEYGPDGEKSKPLMPGNFKKFNETDQNMLDKIELQLKKNENATYKFAVGHHPIGGTCAPDRKTGGIDTLLKKYQYQAYFSGHRHSLAFNGTK